MGWGEERRTLTGPGLPPKPHYEIFDNGVPTSQYQELEDMMWHAGYREYYNTAYAPYYEKKDAKSAALALLDGAMNNIAKMIGGWIRVGFVQGNFNADNCLVGGRTMDYGPFGFLDVYVSQCLCEVHVLVLSTRPNLNLSCLLFKHSTHLVQSGLDRVSTLVS